MAVSAIARQSEDKIMRQAYRRRGDNPASGAYITKSVFTLHHCLRGRDSIDSY